MGGNRRVTLVPANGSVPLLTERGLPPRRGYDILLEKRKPAAPKVSDPTIELDASEIVDVDAEGGEKKESSVLMSLKHLQDIERMRVSEEARAAAKKAAEGGSTLDAGSSDIIVTVEAPEDEAKSEGTIELGSSDMVEGPVPPKPPPPRISKPPPILPTEGDSCVEIGSSDIIGDALGAEKAPAASEGTIELGASEIVEVPNPPRRASRQPPPAPKRSKPPSILPEESSGDVMEVSSSDIIGDADTPSPGRTMELHSSEIIEVPPVPRRPATLPPPGPRKSRPPPILPGEGDGHKPSDSLLTSLAALQEIGRQKDGEKARAPKTAVVAEERKAPDSIVACLEAIVEAEGRRAEEEPSTLSLVMVLGLPWEDRHMEYRLEGKELGACAAILPEKEAVWVTTAPADEKAPGPTVELNGIEYCMVTGEKPDNARRAIRIGDALHLWPASSTEYVLLERAKSETVNEGMSGEWLLDIRRYTLSEKELKQYGPAFPEGKAVWLSSASGEADKKDGYSPVKLAGRSYIAFTLDDVTDWRAAMFNHPKARLASRRGDLLGIWPESENGSTLFESENGFNLTFYGAQGPPLLPLGGPVVPFDLELENIERLYTPGRSVWLYPLPEKLSDLDSDTLNFMITVSNKEMEKGRWTRLVSLQGRWYFALRYRHPEARETRFQDGRVVVQPKRTDISNWALDGETMEIPKIPLPREGEEALRIKGLFPENEIRYLRKVGRDEPYVPRQHIMLVVGVERDVYSVSSEPSAKAIAVMRVASEGQDYLYPVGGSKR